MCVVQINSSFDFLRLLDRKNKAYLPLAALEMFFINTYCHSSEAQVRPGHALELGQRPEERSRAQYLGS